MSFPEKHEGKVMCIGFPDTYFPALKHAVENQLIKWGKCNLYVGSCVAEFEWASATWELQEMNECVTAIRLLKGTPNEMDLTAAVLSS